MVRHFSWEVTAFLPPLRRSYRASTLVSGMLDRRTFLAALAAAPQRKPRKEPRKSDIEVVRLASTRQEGRITYEGTVKITGERPVTGLTLQFEFFESRRVLLSQQKIQIDPTTLAPGDEKQFSIQGSDVPRAVSFRVQACDATGRDLSVAGEGPYPLD